MNTDSICFRFQTEEYGSTMPLWLEYSMAVRVPYAHSFSGQPCSGVEMVNAYFLAAPSEPEDAVVTSRRLVSLEG